MVSRDTLQQKPFSYTETRDGRVSISFHGKQVTTLAGKEAARFMMKAEDLDSHGQQLLMAKATGNFKRGNERDAKPGK